MFAYRQCVSIAFFTVDYDTSCQTSSNEDDPLQELVDILMKDPDACQNATPDKHNVGQNRQNPGW